MTSPLSAPSSAQAAVGQVRSGETICSSGAGSFPLRYFEALTAREDLRDVVVGHPMRQYDLASPLDYVDEASAGRFFHISDFTWDRTIREAVRSGRASYRPANPHQQPRDWQRAYPTGTFVSSVSSPDKHGYVSLGAFGGLGKAFLDATNASQVVFEINAQQPRVLGRVSVPLAVATHYYDVDYELPQVKLSATTSEEDTRIAEHVAELIPDGATLQLGVGTIPDIVARLLVDSGKRHLGIHSENFGDSIVDLIEAGVVDNSRKSSYQGLSVCTLALGTNRTYRFLDDNPGVQMLPMTYVNNPDVIAQGTIPIAVNATLMVDLSGQCASESIGAAHYSGTGGQWEFIHGANQSNDGRGILTLKSTAKSGAISTIVPMLPEGSAVTVPRNEGATIVTEFGTADLRGRSVHDRAKNLIGIAHPKFRDQLAAEARKMGMLR
jgi:4-hydroxybutyrate CoA-transferase